jgi:hypothetical protein
MPWGFYRDTVKAPSSCMQGMVSNDDIAHKKKSRWNTLRVYVGYRR